MAALQPHAQFHAADLSLLCFMLQYRLYIVRCKNAFSKCVVNSYNAILICAVLKLVHEVAILNDNHLLSSHKMSVKYTSNYLFFNKKNKEILHILTIVLNTSLNLKSNNTIITKIPCIILNVSFTRTVTVN